jgi:hypothetical protein
VESPDLDCQLQCLVDGVSISHFFAATFVDPGCSISHQNVSSSRSVGLQLGHAVCRPGSHENASNHWNSLRYRRDILLRDVSSEYQFTGIGPSVDHVELRHHFANLLDSAIEVEQYAVSHGFDRHLVI